MMNFAAVVSTEPWQSHPHRMLEFRLDIAVASMAAVFRHLDNIADFDTGFTLLDQVLLPH